MKSAVISATKEPSAGATARPTNRENIEKRSLQSRLFEFIFGTHSLALVDQAVVSAASFVTTVLVGRYSDPSQLGAYAIAASVLASSLAVQRSLIALPYAIQRHRPFGSPAEHAGSVLTQNHFLSALIVVVLTLAACGLSDAGAHRQLVTLTWALVGVMPFVLLREFYRRIAFAHLDISDALILDMVVAALQLAMLGSLAWMGHISAVTACAAIGLASALPALGWMYIRRANFVVRRGYLKRDTRQSWRLGKWLLAGQATVQVQLYAAYWLSALIGGAAVTGVYAASMSIVSFANPLLFGLGNIMSARSALAWNTGGGATLRRQTIEDAMMIAALMSVFCVIVFLAGGDIIRFLYHGREYEGQGGIAAILALATMAASLSMPASNALASIERANAAAVAGAIGATITVLFVWYLMSRWGLRGAAVGLLIGSILTTIGRWFAFLILVPRRDNSAVLSKVLEGFIAPSKLDHCTVTHLGHGDHANVYAVEAKDGSPVWRTAPSLIVKLYKPSAALTLEMVEQQFDALVKLRAALDGQHINDWKICTPEPLYLCKSPLAIVMTRVSGQDLLSATRSALSTHVLRSTAELTASLVRKALLKGQRHGDFGLQNIFLDIEAKTISLIDPGTFESCCVCNAKNNSQNSAICDLGHMLCDAGADIKTLILSRSVQSRRQMLAELTLRAFLMSIETERLLVLERIVASAEVHLAETFPLSFSPRGLWRWFKKEIGGRRIRSIDTGLRRELGLLGPQSPSSSVASGHLVDEGLGNA